MPCFCHYDPPEIEKRLIKVHCLVIIKHLRDLHAIGDPIGCGLEDVKKLLDHLWDPKSCEEYEH